MFLPGLTFDLEIPGFRFFSLGIYTYVDRGEVEGASNGCNDTTYQITPSWSLPFTIGSAKVRFDGFIDFIGDHGRCSSQVQSRPSLKIDLGALGSYPDRLFGGVEWQYWHSKLGIEGLDESFPKFTVMWVF